MGLKLPWLNPNNNLYTCVRHGSKHFTLISMECDGKPRRPPPLETSSQLCPGPYTPLWGFAHFFLCLECKCLCSSPG